MHIGHPLNIVLAVAACYFSFRDARVRGVAVRLAVSIFVALSVSDTVLSILNPEILSGLWESYLCNALGSPLLATFMCIILMGGRKVADIFPRSEMILTVLFPLIFGVFVFLGLYAIVRTFFWATPSDLNVTVQTPVRGSYSAKGDGQSIGTRNFGVFVGKNSSPSDFSWNGIADGLRLGLAAPSEFSSLEIFALDGCTNGVDGRVVSRLGTPYLSRRKVKSVGLTMDDGMASFSIYSSGKDLGYWSASEDDVSMFWVGDSEKNSRNVDLSVFTSPKVSVSHFDWRGDVYYYLSAIEVDGAGALKERSFFINVDGDLVRLNFRPSSTMSVDGALGCGPAKADQSGFSTRYPAAAVVLKVSYPAARYVSDLNQGGSAWVSGFKGVLAMPDLHPDKVDDYVQSGRLRFMAVSGNMKEAHVDGAKVETREDGDFYFMDGNLSASVDGRDLRMRGTTGIAELDGRRITKTRWERVGFLMMSFFGAIGVGGLYLVRVFFRHFKSNTVLTLER